MKISVIIPVRNEALSIRQLLGSLKNQTHTPAEIVITDTGSTDGTPEIIEEFDAGTLPVRLIRGGPGYPGRGRNLAAAQASCEWLAFIDAGIRPAAGWLAALAERAEAEGADVVYGGWEPVIGSFFQECAAIAYVPPPAKIGDALMRPRFIASALMRRSVWQAVGGFPEDLRSAEDLLFMDSVEAAGFEIVYAPKAIVHWNLQPTLLKTFNRFVTYSRNNIRAGLWANWQSTLFRRYAMLLLLTLASLFLVRDWPAIGLGLPLLAWLLMILARSVIAIWRNRRCYPAGIGRNLVRLGLLAPLLAVIDLAAIVGSFQWLLTDRSYTNDKARGVKHDA